MKRNPTGYLGSREFEVADYHPINDAYTAILNMWGISSRTVSATYLTCAVADLYGEQTYITRVGNDQLIKYEVGVPSPSMLKLVFKEIAKQYPDLFKGVDAPKQYKKFYDGFKEAVQMVIAYTQENLEHSKYRLFRGLKVRLQPELRARTIESWASDINKAEFYGEKVYETTVNDENIIAADDLDYSLFNPGLNVTDKVSTEYLVFTGEYENFEIYGPLNWKEMVQRGLVFYRELEDAKVDLKEIKKLGEEIQAKCSELVKLKRAWMPDVDDNTYLNLYLDTNSWKFGHTLQVNFHKVKPEEFYNSIDYIINNIKFNEKKFTRMEKWDPTRSASSLRDVNRAKELITEINDLYEKYYKITEHLRIVVD